MWNNERGITLIEVLAAVVILGIAVVIFTNISSYSMLVNKQSDHKSEALRLAGKKLSEIRNDIETSPTPIEVGTQNVGSTLIAGTIYSYSVVETSLANGQVNNTQLMDNNVSVQAIVLLTNPGAGREQRLITVTVSWPGISE